MIRQDRNGRSERLQAHRTVSREALAHFVIFAVLAAIVFWLIARTHDFSFARHDSV